MNIMTCTYILSFIFYYKSFFVLFKLQVNTILTTNQVTAERQRNSFLLKRKCCPPSLPFISTKAPTVCSVQPSGDGSKYRASLYLTTYFHCFYFAFILHEWLILHDYAIKYFFIILHQRVVFHIYPYQSFWPIRI